MNVQVQDDWLLYTDIEPFNLDRTLGSGQTFRWIRKGKGYEGFVKGSLIEVRQQEGVLWARTFPVALDRELIENYFSLRFPLRKALIELAKDEQLAGALHRQAGIRILHQEPWECLASFILAINKSIPQIEKTIGALCEKLGRKIRAGRRTFSLFPTPEMIATAPEGVLRATKMGFRARYLRAAAEKLIRDQIDLVQYSQVTYAEARSALMDFYGIGPKVADCICLFALGHQDAFPVDVWIQRVMEQYGSKTRSNPARIQEIAKARFGHYAGLAQQYLYHDIRCRVRSRSRKGG